MIDEKRVEQEYRKLQKNAAPDLWDRIEGRLEAHPEREGGIRQEDSIGQEDMGGRAEPGNMVRRKTFRHRYGYGLTAAAAVLVITVGLNTVRNRGEMAMETIASVTEAAAEAEPPMIMEGKPEEQSGIMDGKLSVQADGAMTLEQLSVSEYTALSVPERAVTVPEDTWYFSEDILADTELLCGAKVNGVSFEEDSSGNAVNVVYDMTIDEVYYAEDYASNAQQIQVRSPIVKADGDEAYLLYQLQADGIYLLPLKKQAGTWELIFPFAPQIRVLKDEGYLFHSGYTSLTDGGTSVVVGQQEAANDYYFDRMLYREGDSFLSDFLALVEQEVQGRS